MKAVILLLFGILPIMALCQNKDSEMIRFIMQPEVELNKQMELEIIFDSKPDKGSLQIDSVNGLDIMRINGFGQVLIQEKGDNYSFYTYATPTKLGKIEIPPVRIKVNGVEYESKPFIINVVNNINIDSNSIKLVLVADKSTYKLQDTIKLSLYQYSKFSQANGHAVKKDTVKIKPADISITGKDNTLEVKANNAYSLYDVTGIENIEEYPDKDLEWIDIKWNMFEKNQTMEILDSQNYIKTEVFSCYFLAHTQGEYKFQPSIFEYLIYKNKDDYFGKFVPNEKGSYSITDNGSAKLKVTSNPITIIVK